MKLKNGDQLLLCPEVNLSSKIHTTVVYNAVCVCIHVDGCFIERVCVHACMRALVVKHVLCARVCLCKWAFRSEFDDVHQGALCTFQGESTTLNIDDRQILTFLRPKTLLFLRHRLRDSSQRGRP